MGFWPYRMWANPTMLRVAMSSPSPEASTMPIASWTPEVEYCIRTSREALVTLSEDNLGHFTPKLWLSCSSSYS